MPFRLPRALVVLATALITCSAAATTAPTCTDRQRAAERPAGVPARLPELIYQCERLERSGTAVWIGEAGRQHDTSVLLVHGLGHMAHRDWRAVIGPLAAQFHVIVVDLPGFGASDALGRGHSFADLDRALDEVVARHARGGRAHVVGHSLGGAVSLNFAHRHPDRVDRLVLVDAAGILLMNLLAMTPERVALPEVGIAGVDRVMRRVDARVNGWGRSLVGRIDNNVDLGRWLKRNPAVRHALLGPHTQVNAAIGLMEHDFSEAVREVRAPTTLIWGADDPVAPVRTGRALAARMNDARLHVIDHTGHVPMNQRPVEFQALLMTALAGPAEPREEPPPAPPASQGDMACDARLGAQYTGRFGHIELVNCQDVVIRDAQLDRLTMVNSTATLDNVTIGTGDGVAMDARRSKVVATGVTLSGRVAVRADASTLDLAAARLSASERGVEVVTPSWVYFSISEIVAPDHRGSAHLAWPTTPTPRP